jgi:hypothetical protein
MFRFRALIHTARGESTTAGLLEISLALDMLLQKDVGMPYFLGHGNPGQGFRTYQKSDR